MFFVSNRDGGQGRLDIWYSTWDGEYWSDPQNAGARINTPFNDVSPYLNNAGNALYFASDGRVGFGGLDLYKAEGQMGRWNEPVNIGRADQIAPMTTCLAYGRRMIAAATSPPTVLGATRGVGTIVYLAEAIPEPPKELRRTWKGAGQRNRDARSPLVP